MSRKRVQVLNNGLNIPVIGIGCWMGYVGGGDEVTQMVQDALEVGYRHIDTAFNYGNEGPVGEGIRNSGIPRKDLFITTKLTGEDHGRVFQGFETSLSNLGCEYIDLFLMHWPQSLTDEGQALQPEEHPTFIDTWKDMEKLLQTGKVKSIGVSNFSIKNLDILLAQVDIVPAVNQVETHPLLPQTELLAYCKAKSIVLTAYSPIGKHKDILVKHPAIVSITARLGCTAAQVLLSWNVSRGVVVVPKTTNKHRMEENLLFVHLLPEEMDALTNIHCNPGFHRSVCGFHLPGGICFGWTYEQLGWPMREGGIVW